MPEFEKLAVWQRAHELALLTYELTTKLPDRERYALQSQVRRAAVAVPANIAEGQGRGSDTEFAPFLRIALGSLAELQSLMLLARDLGYVSAEDLTEFWPKAAAAAKMLNSLLKRVRADKAG